MQTRAASPKDAKALAYLIDLAGEGLPSFLWAGMASENEKPLDVGARRAAREEGSFSYRNATVVEIDGEPAAMVLGYLQPETYDLSDLAQYPEVVRPLVELEALESGSWYINAIATYEKFRGRGIATDLMNLSEDHAKSRGAKRISLIVASENISAKRLYEKLGYLQVASRPVIPFEGCLHEGHWLLMAKDVVISAVKS